MNRLSPYLAALLLLALTPILVQAQAINNPNGLSVVNTIPGGSTQQSTDSNGRAFIAPSFNTYLAASGVTNSVLVVKGTTGLVTPATLDGYYIYNGSGNTAYVQFFDAAFDTAVTLGVTAPKISLGIPSGAGANLSPGLGGIAFANGIKIAATTTRSGSTAPSTVVDVNLFYK